MDSTIEGEKTENKMQDKVVVFAERLAVPVGRAFPSARVYIKRTVKLSWPILATISIHKRQIDIHPPWLKTSASKSFYSQWVAGIGFRIDCSAEFHRRQLPGQQKFYTITTKSRHWCGINSLARLFSLVLKFRTKKEIKTALWSEKVGKKNIWKRSSCTVSLLRDITLVIYVRKKASRNLIRPACFAVGWPIIEPLSTDPASYAIVAKLKKKKRSIT